MDGGTKLENSLLDVVMLTLKIVYTTIRRHKVIGRMNEMRTHKVVSITYEWKKTWS